MRRILDSSHHVIDRSYLITTAAATIKIVITRQTIGFPHPRAIVIRGY